MRKKITPKKLSNSATNAEVEEAIKRDMPEIIELEKKVELEQLKIKLKANSSSSHTKTIYHWNNVLNSSDFLEEIRLLRKKYKIPTTGFSIDDPHEEIEGCSLYPMAWKHKSNIDVIHSKMHDDMTNLALSFDLPPISSGNLFNCVLYKDSPPQLTHSAASCFVSDRLQERDYEGDELPNDIYYPVAIRVHPSTSQREILDFVKKNYTTVIKPLQDKYVRNESTVGKNRKRSPRIIERNNFIYENRDKKISVISSLIAKKYGFSGVLDEGHISKIIQLEKKRRS